MVNEVRKEKEDGEKRMRKREKKRRQVMKVDKCIFVVCSRQW
jgi:hypothetical protein